MPCYPRPVQEMSERAEESWAVSGGKCANPICKHLKKVNLPLLLNGTVGLGKVKKGNYP
jgi:hypothetical protein